MPTRKIVQDILPTKRRSIRDVTLDKDPAKKSPARVQETRAERGIRVPIHLDHAAEAKRSSPAPGVPKEPRSGRKAKTGRNAKWFVGGIAIVCLIAIAYTASVILAHATVSINLRSESVPVSGSFSAAQNAESPNLSFETISTTTVAHASVAASIAGTVNSYAAGMAILINASSPSPQKILAGTRLSDGRGLVYKTVSTVVIPAATSKSAGTVTVNIIASAPGPAYDSSLSNLKGDLSILAWQGTSKAKVFYGRMTTDMTGGSSGPRMSVASTTLASASAALSSKLLSIAEDALQSTVPAGYILYPKAAGITLSPAMTSSLGSTTADVSMSAVATGVIFKATDLENLLAKTQIAQFPADNYEVDGLSSLVFAPAVGQSFSAATGAIQFSLNGNLEIVGVIDPNAIKSQLSGKPLSSSNSIFSQYSSVIGSAQVSVSPFWVHTIPSSQKRISVIVSTTTVSGH